MTGSLAHIDFSVADPAVSIPFYDALLTVLGYTRWRSADPAWQEPGATRAAWYIRNPDGSRFAIDLRPALRLRRYDRYEPGPHHIAFDAADHDAVHAAHRAMRSIGADILDPPAEYGGASGNRDAYGDHYFALFVADPDGVKLEVCCTAAP